MDFSLNIDNQRNGLETRYDWDANSVNHTGYHVAFPVHSFDCLWFE